MAIAPFAIRPPTYCIRLVFFAESRRVDESTAAAMPARRWRFLWHGTISGYSSTHTTETDVTKDELLRDRTYKEDGIETSRRVFYTLTDSQTG
ncbi:hypothetical protein, partial [Burkholderia cenocepacia]